MKLISVAIVLVLAACSRGGASNGGSPTPAAEQPASVTAALATAETFRKYANDAAVWIDGADPSKSLLVVSGGEGGIEIDDLSGARVARFEAIEAGFVEIRQAVDVSDERLDLVIASDQRLGALRVYALDAPARSIRELTAAPIAIDDAITGLCTYRSALTGALYAFAATDQGQLEQWQLYFDGGKAHGRFVRRIPAGHGASHCVADDASGTVYFSEESVGIWRVAAEPESDSAREAVDLVAPRGTIEEEVKGLALHGRGTQAPALVAANAGAKAFNVYSTDGKRIGTFSVSGTDDVEGITLVSEPMGSAFPHGLLVIADEGTGNYKLVSWNAVEQALKLASPAAAPGEPPAKPRHARTVQPKVETVPADSYGDAADDPAIWVDKRNPSRSVVIGTDKKLGLNVYDLAGKRLQVVPDGRMNNVDLREGFTLGGRSIVIVAATNRTTRSIGLYKLDTATLRLSSVADGTLDSGLSDPYGLCLYHSAKSGGFYVLANDSADGKFRQWKLTDRGGKVGLEQVREFVVGSQAEGCAADDELGSLYIAEEDVGLWKYSAEPDGDSNRTAVDKVEGGNLVADAEGVAIWYGADGKGYVIVSNQGEDNYAVYRREGSNEFMGKFHVVANEGLGIDGASETDGLDVVSAPLGDRFPAGMLVVQDGRNLMPAARQNFKYVSWQDVLTALE